METVELCRASVLKRTSKYKGIRAIIAAQVRVAELVRRDGLKLHCHLKWRVGSTPTPGTEIKSRVLPCFLFWSRESKTLSAILKNEK